MAKAKKAKAVEPLKTWEDDFRRVYTAEDVAAVMKAAELISAGFTWAMTKEGDDYWIVVYERLRDIAAEIERRIENGFDARL